MKELTAVNSFEEWVEFGRQLRNQSEGLNWAIGDWWAFGERQGYGDRVRAARELGIKEQWAMDCGFVARTFPTTSRRREVSFTVHRELTPHPYLLDRAAAEEWTKKQARHEVKLLAGPAPEPPNAEPEEIIKKAVGLLSNLTASDQSKAFAEIQQSLDIFAGVNDDPYASEEELEDAVKNGARTMLPFGYWRNHDREESPTPSDEGSVSEPFLAPLAGSVSATETRIAELEQENTDLATELDRMTDERDLWRERALELGYQG